MFKNHKIVESEMYFRLSINHPWYDPFRNKEIEINFLVYLIVWCIQNILIKIMFRYTWTWNQPSLPFNQL